MKYICSALRWPNKRTKMVMFCWPELGYRRAAQGQRQRASCANFAFNRLIQFDHAVKGQPRIIIWKAFTDLVSLMLYTKIRPQVVLDCGEKDFKVFNHVRAWRQFWSTECDHLNKLCPHTHPPTKKKPHLWWFDKYSRSGFRQDIL